MSKITDGNYRMSRSIKRMLMGMKDRKKMTEIKKLFIMSDAIDQKAEKVVLQKGPQ